VNRDADGRDRQHRDADDSPDGRARHGGSVERPATARALAAPVPVVPTLVVTIGFGVGGAILLP
jgi:hypothetical protein